MAAVWILLLHGNLDVMIAWDGEGYGKVGVAYQLALGIGFGSDPVGRRAVG